MTTNKDPMLMLFSQGLQIQAPWELVEQQMLPTGKDGALQMHVTVKFAAKKAAHPSNPMQLCEIVDTEEKTYTIPGFFQFETVAHVMQPCIQTPEGMKVIAINAFWAK